jgi:hypothetical protein
LPKAHPLFPLPRPLFLAAGRGEESGEEEEEQGKQWEQKMWEQMMGGLVVWNVILI